MEYANFRCKMESMDAQAFSFLQVNAQRSSTHQLFFSLLNAGLLQTRQCCILAPVAASGLKLDRAIKSNHNLACILPIVRMHALFAGVFFSMGIQQVCHAKYTTCSHADGLLSTQEL
jgi:hypothetical protein